MSDLISRQAAIKAIRKDMYADKDYMSAMICEGIEDVLNGLPSADPEIIRCKDCANREFCRTSTIWAVPPGDYWFCADADRRRLMRYANAVIWRQMTMNHARRNVST